MAEGVRESDAKVMCRRVGCESLCGRDDAWVGGGVMSVVWMVPVLAEFLSVFVAMSTVLEAM